MFHRSTLALCAVALLLLSCSAAETSEDVLRYGKRNAKLYAKEQLKLDVDDDLFLIRGDTQNNEWTRYWGRVAEYEDPEPTKWNDKIHTVYAFYFLPPDAQPGDAIWIFVNRTDGAVAGMMKTGRGYRDRFGG